MPTLYFQEQGVMVRKRDNQVLITKDGQTLSEVPLAKIDQVVLMGRGVQLSTALLIDLLERGIPVTFTNQHGMVAIMIPTDRPERSVERKRLTICLRIPPLSTPNPPRARRGPGGAGQGAGRGAGAAAAGAVAWAWASSHPPGRTILR